MCKGLGVLGTAAICAMLAGLSAAAAAAGVRDAGPLEQTVAAAKAFTAAGWEHAAAVPAGQVDRGRVVQVAGWFSTPPYPPEHRYTPSAAAAGTAPTAAPTQSARAIRAPANPGLGGLISEVRGGVLYHDSGPISSSSEEGIDINGEVLFTSPDIFRYILSPRPHLGGSINTAGDTSQGYFGLTWTADIYDNFFVEFSFGGSVHDGELNADKDDRNDLGCRLLFRESISAGVLFGGVHSVSVMFDHISNAGQCEDNDGQDTVGVRYGYRF